MKDFAKQSLSPGDTHPTEGDFIWLDPLTGEQFSEAEALDGSRSIEVREQFQRRLPAPVSYEYLDAVPLFPSYAKISVIEAQQAGQSSLDAQALSPSAVQHSLEMKSPPVPQENPTVGDSEYPQEIVDDEIQVFEPSSVPMEATTTQHATVSSSAPSFTTPNVDSPRSTGSRVPSLKVFGSAVPNVHRYLSVRKRSTPNASVKTKASSNLVQAPATRLLRVAPRASTVAQPMSTMASFMQTTPPLPSTLTGPSSAPMGPYSQPSMAFSLGAQGPLASVFCRALMHHDLDEDSLRDTSIEELRLLTQLYAERPTIT